MIDAQDPHVGAAARAALLDRVGGRVVELHERHGTGRDARGRPHHRPLGPQAREAEAGAAAALMDDRHRLERVVDPVLAVRERIGDRQHETGAQLPQRPARVHERRRVGLEPALGHEMVEILTDRLHRPVARTISPVCVGYGRRHPPEHLLRLLRRRPCLVLDQISLLEHGASVRRQRRGSSRRVGGQRHDDAPTRNGTGPTGNLAEPALKTPRTRTGFARCSTRVTTGSAMRTEILAAIVYPRQWFDKPLQDNVLCFEHHNRSTVGVLSTLPDRLRPVTSRTPQSGAPAAAKCGECTLVNNISTWALVGSPAPQRPETRSACAEAATIPTSIRLPGALAWYHEGARPREPSAAPVRTGVRTSRRNRPATRHTPPRSTPAPPSPDGPGTMRRIEMPCRS